MHAYIYADTHTYVHAYMHSTMSKEFRTIGMVVNFIPKTGLLSERLTYSLNVTLND